MPLFRDEVGILVSEDEEEQFDIVRAEDAGEVRVMLSVAAKCLPKIHFGALAALKAAQGRAACTGTVDKASRAIVLLNGHNDYAWNARRQLFCEALRSATSDASASVVYEREIALNDLVLTKHPKTDETWAYRQWATAQRYPLAELPAVVVERELDACSRAAAAYPRNYYAWQHRLWVLGRTTSAELLGQELLWTEKWVVGHSSDYSALAYRQNVFLRLCPCDEAAWKVESYFTLAMIMLCPGVEGLWSHLRFCMHHYYTRLRAQESAAGKGRPQDVELDFYDNLPAVTEKIRAESETLPLPDASLMRAFCMAVAEDKSLWNYELNKHFSERFIAWLEFLK